MSASIQATLSTYRRSGPSSIPLPNLRPYLVSGDDDFYYGTRGVSSRLATLSRLAYLPHDSSLHLTSVEINIAGAFGGGQADVGKTSFAGTAFFYVQQARRRELDLISETWSDLVRRDVALNKQDLRDRRTDWSDPESYMVDHPQGAALLFKSFAELKVLGIPMKTVFGDVVMVTMFRKGDAPSLIRWVRVSGEKVEVTLDTPEGPLTLPKRPVVDRCGRCCAL